MSGEEEFRAYNAVSPLSNGYCRDTAAILGLASNLDLLSPALALGEGRGEDAFPVVRAFLAHIFKSVGQFGASDSGLRIQNYFRDYHLVSDLQKPNCSLVLAYSKLSTGMKEALLSFFFEEMKIAR